MSDKATDVQGFIDFLDPQKLKEKVLATAVFIAIYEATEDRIVEKVKGFFCNGFDNKGLTYSPEYLSEVLTLENSWTYKVTKIGKELKASLIWLKNMDVIDDSDIVQFLQLRDDRNTMTHEFLSNLTRGHTASQEQINALIQLVRKIEIWWVKNIEIGTNPDLDQYLTNPPEDKDITSGTETLFSVLSKITLGND